MSDAPPEQSVAAPRLFAEFEPSVSKWSGRTGFFALGLGAFFVDMSLVGALRNAGFWDPTTYWLPVSIALALVAAVIVMRVQQGPRWRWISFAAGITLLPAAFAAIFVVAPWVESVVKTRAFDGAAWAGDGDIDSSRRAWMVDDLLERHPLRGRTRAEIEALLGRPDSGETAAETVYFLGIDRQRGFLSGFEILEITYDSADRVVAERVCVCD